MKTPFELSLALQEANNRLFALRLQQGIDNPPQREDGVSVVSLSPVSVEKTLAAMPAHLGWQSQVVTKHVRGRVVTSVGEQKEGKSKGQKKIAFAPKQQEAIASDKKTPKPPLLIYPSLALAMLQTRQVSAGRVWWLCRHFDVAGQGVFRIAKIREQLAGKHATFRLCGWRRLRQILAEGEGIFWKRYKERLWLRSAVKVADTLGVEKFQGKVVEMPASTFCQSIGKVRAHLYAMFHASRTTKNPEMKTHPIARQTLETMTGVGRRTQQAYEQHAGISVQHNIVLGNPLKTNAPPFASATSDQLPTISHQERAWQQGNAYFELKDYRGYHGKRGAMYMAWQLPNSYTAPHTPNGRGRQKYLNRHLNDLRMKREAGNRQEWNEGICRRYFKDGVGAGKAQARQPHQAMYWQAGLCRSGKGQWYEVPAIERTSRKVLADATYLIGKRKMPAYASSTPIASLGMPAFSPLTKEGCG
jgi:hypothetical protein